MHTQPNIFITLISRLNVNNKPTVVSALDLEKAFISVWVNGLKYKLIENNFPIPIIRIAVSF